MDRGAIEDLIGNFYAARVAGDVEALGRAFAADARFQIAGSPEASMLATVAEGHDGVMSLVRTMADSFALENFQVLDLLIDGGRVAVRWRAAIQQMTSGETHETEIADFIEVRDGKVAHLVEFLDTALAG